MFPPARLATEADMEPMLDTLAPALEADPWTDFTVPEDDRHSRFRGLCEIALSGALAVGEVWVTEGCEAVAAWYRSDNPPDVRDLARAEHLSGDRREVAGRAGDELDDVRLEEFHWYLQNAAVRADLRRQGLGRRVLEPRLSRCDEEGCVAALETSNEEAVRFYKTLGFVTRLEHDISGGGPHVWLMRRDPS